MARTRFTITPTTPNVGYAINSGWTYANGEIVAGPPAPTRPQIVGTPAVIVAARRGINLPRPARCRYFVGDLVIDDTRNDPMDWLKWLAEGKDRKIEVWLWTTPPPE